MSIRHSSIRHNPFSEDRKTRKLDIIKFLANSNNLIAKGGWVSTRRLTGSFSIKWGISVKVLNVYLNEMADAGILLFNEESTKLSVDDNYLDELFGSREQWQEKTTKETQKK
jgi:hypothetical protein